MKRVELWRGCALVSMFVASAACGPDKPVPVTPTPTATAAASAAPTDPGTPTLADGAGGARVGSGKLADRRERTALAADTLDSTGRSAAPPKSSTEIYKSLAPATVIIRVGGGLGSGVIIDPAGWVLTNNHVIEHGKTEGFKFKATVLVGQLSKETGAMERTDKEYEAWVHKADKLRDIALLKIKDPPKNLPYVKIAKQKPTPGNAITSIGHAGAGMLWAVKSCQIAALGKLADHLAQVAAFKNDDEGKKAKEQFKKYVESHNLGLVIQSTCNILPGDSGGPVVNDQGELVGLNVFSRRDNRTGGLISFHVHHAEIAKFAKDKPKNEAQLVPDPWQDGGGDMSFEDADLDGKVDVLMLQGRKPCFFCPRESVAAFIDADQNSYQGRAALPKLQDAYEKKDFEPEAVYLQTGRTVMIWYDSDDDGKFDKLLVDEHTTGRVDAGYTIDKDGKLTKDASLSTGKPFRPALFAHKEMHERFARVARAAFPERYTDAPTPTTESLPDPIGSTGSAMAMDLNLDGKLDGALVSAVFSKRLLVDADQTFAASTGRYFDMAKASKASLDPEISIVSQTQTMWVYYDTDDDGTFDLLLVSPGARLYVAKEVFKLDAQGNKTAVIEHVGRKLFRPGLLTKADQSKTAHAMVKHHLLSIMSANENDGLSSFPDPLLDHRGTRFEALDVKGMPKNTVITVVGYGSDGYLIDLDRNTKWATYKDGDKKGKEDLYTTLLKDKKLDAEFAYFNRGGVAWAFYDVDRAAGYDVVLVSTDPSKGLATGGFRIDAKKGVATYDAKLVGKPMVQHSLFQGFGEKARMKKLAPELFAESMIEK